VPAEDILREVRSGRVLAVEDLPFHAERELVGEPGGQDGVDVYFHARIPLSERELFAIIASMYPIPLLLRNCPAGVKPIPAPVDVDIPALVRL
jgi:hypothetical protein